MAPENNAHALAHTLKCLYGELLELPLLRPTAQPRQNSDTPPSQALAAFQEEIRFCSRCVLHIGRSQLVFGKGHPGARVAFVGDFPSLEDDQEGAPFSGESGALLNRMITAMKLRPEETYLTNLFKCRPPQGQTIDQELARICGAHLERQFEHLSAELIVAMGEASAKALARADSPLAVLRGQTFPWKGRKVFCTHHPRELLASPAKKKEAWEDLQSVMRELGR